MWVLLSTFLVLVFCFYIRNKYNYWKKRGVDTPKYHYFFGNLWEQFLFRKNTSIILQDSYKAFQGYNYIGYYNAMQPGILIRSPQIIGDVIIKDFSSFMDNDYNIAEHLDPVYGKNPFVLKGQRWKQVRAQATPSFTSGKVKIMLPQMKATSIKFLNYLKNHENTGVDLYALATRITAENVSTCGFGLEGGSFSEEMNAPFVEIANQLLEPTFWNSIKTLMIFLCPTLTRIKGTGFFQQRTIDYLDDITEQTLQYRRENNVNASDLLDEMQRLRAKINDDSIFNSLDIMGHTGGLIIDGVLSSATLLAYLIHDLAVNPDIQEKLREEIEKSVPGNPEDLTYELIQEMTYLDCVVKESLRQHPPLMYMMRKVTKPYRMQPMLADNTGPCVELEVGTPVMISIYALHMDEKYFPEPEKYKPCRWLPENKDNIVKNTYLPFGDGPRVCIGMRFGLLQTKMALISIIRSYRVKPNEKTQLPFHYSPANFLNEPVGGLWAEFTKL